MNDKEAIERCYRRINELKLNFAITNEDLKAIETILNLIEKQKAEIERLNSIVKTDDIISKARAEVLEEFRAEIEELKAKLEYKQYNDLDNIEFEKYIEKIVKERTEKLYKEIETLKRDFEIVDHECSRLEQEDIRKDEQIEQYINMLATNDMLHVLECEKKDKIIDLMAEWLYEDDSIFGFGIFKEINTPEKIKEYFENKVKEK